VPKRDKIPKPTTFVFYNGHYTTRDFCFNRNFVIVFFDVL